MKKFVFSKSATISFLSVFVFLFFFFVNTSKAATDCTNTATTGVSQTECEALVAFYNSTNGATWNTKTNWNTNTAVSAWNGIVVGGGHVTSISLTGNNLTGTLPTEIGNLTYLTWLNLWNNSITGSIPSSVGNMTGLTYFSLAANSLSGAIPTSIGNLTNLAVLMLHNNSSMSGVIPAEIGNLTNLETLYLSSNNFTAGPIPANWSNLTKLSTLSLTLCNLTGAIPSFIGNFSSLVTLDLSRNNLSGTIPTEIGNLSNLITLKFNVNSLTGSLPAGIVNLTKLDTLNINNNSLTGAIPSGIANIATLAAFNISNNKFVFSDFESENSVYSTKTFTKSPQAAVDTVRSINFMSRELMTITPPVASNANDRYQWYKDAVAISGATSRIYTKTAGDDDSGIYTYVITNTIVIGLTLSSNNITVSVIPNPPVPNSIYYIASSTEAWVRGRISDGKDMAQNYLLVNSNNSNFNFNSSFLISSSASNSIDSYSSGVLVASPGDDAAPIRTDNIGYIMANHGLQSPVITSVGHNKTGADIGSTWSDSGGYQFILASISGNDLTFYSIPSGNPWVMRTTIIGASLTHVSGASHTTAITVSSWAGVQQYPMVKNLVRHTLVNGVTETVSGSGYADYIDFTEEFDLIDPSTIVRTNNPWVWNDAEVWMHVRNVYRATGGNTTIHTTYNIVRPMNIGYLGIIQAQPLVATSYDHLYLYVPKTKPILGYDYKAIQAFDDAPSGQMYFTSEYIDDVSNPPNRQIEFLKKNSDDNYDLGFAFGYGPYADGAAENRNCVGAGCLYIYTTKKVYPMLISSPGVVDDITYEAYAYRQWIDPKQYDSGKTVYWNKQNNRDLVYIDYHRGAVNDTTTLPAEFAGYTTRVVESENIAAPVTKIADNSILTLSTTGTTTYGFMVLELTPSVSTPMSSLSAGSYNEAKDVSLSATGSDSIRYSTTGIPATCSAGSLYSSALHIASSQTIYVRACNSFGNSATSSFAYIIDTVAPETPTPSILSGTYGSDQSLTLSAGPGEYIRYSSTGIPATCSAGELYTSSIAINDTKTIYVRTCDAVGNSSSASYSYTISRSSGFIAPPPVKQDFVLSLGEASGIRYSVDGVPKTCADGLDYSQILKIAKPQTIYARVCDVPNSYSYLIDMNVKEVPGRTDLQKISFLTTGDNYIKYSLKELPKTCAEGSLYTSPLEVSKGQVVYTKVCGNFSKNANPAPVINNIPKIVSDISKITKDLKLGMKSAEVKILQLFLIKEAHGPSALALKKNGVTNNFGALTMSALAEWQKGHKVSPASGYFGAKTREKIKSLGL